MYLGLFVMSMTLLNSVFLMTMCSFDNVYYFDENEFEEN